MTRSPLSKDNIQSIYNLSPLQLGLLYHAIEARGHDPYHAQHCFHLTGALDLDHFARAWQTTLDRHPILRSAFFWEQVKQPLQIVAKRATLAIEHLDWSHLAPEAQEAELNALLEQDRAAGFHLNRPPLIRLFTARTGPDALWFVLSAHHLILDGWSLSIVLGEVLEQVHAAQTGRAPQLPAVRPFESYIAWLKGRNDLEKETFWREYLQGFDALTSPGIPAKPQPTTTDELPYRECVRDLSGTESARIERVARSRGFTLNTLVLAAWGLLLNRYTGRDDVLFGATVAGRPPELAGSDAMVGMFINTLPARIDFSGDPLVHDLLRRIQERHLALQHYSHTPLVDIQKWWSDRDAESTGTLFDHLVVFENYPIDAALQENSGLTIAPRYEGFGEEEGAVITHGRNHYPLTLVIVPGPRVRLIAAYDRSFLDNGRARALLDRLHILMGQLVEGLDRRTSSVPALSGAELRGHLASGSVGRGYDRSETIHGLVARFAQTQGDRTALIHADGGMSYRELHRAARLLAQVIRNHGLIPGDTAAIHLPREPRWVVAMLAILEAGAAFVPLDPQFPEERARYMVEDSGARLVLGLGSAAFPLPEGTSWLDMAHISTNADDRARPLPVAVDGSATAYVMYTSGTTGRPKGVRQSHRSVHNYAVGLLDRLEPEPDATFASLATPAADLGYTALFGALCGGYALHILSHELALDAVALAEALERTPVDYLKITPSHLQGLLSVDRPARVLPRKTLILGGEASDVALIEEVRALAPTCRVLNHYGPTEATIGVLTHDLGGVDAEHPLITLGHPLANSHVYVLDPHGHPQPIGFPGELYIESDGLADGYHRRAALSAEKFVPNPFARKAGSRLYRTGDRGRLLADGTIEFLGRVDDQVKIRGYRVEPAEVARRISARAGIRQAAVVASETPGTGSLRLVAYVVTEQATSDLHDRLRRALEADLPNYMVPAAFVTLAELPVTANGKLDRRALPQPEETQSPDEPSFTEPRDAVERLLAQCWRDLLSQPRIGIHDNVYAAGADSILCLQAMAQLKQLGYSLTPRQVFANPTVAGMATVIGGPHRETEQHLLGGLRELLSQPELDRHAHFYAAGGDSIVALQWVAMARQQGLNLTPGLIFRHPTVAELAQALVGTERDVESTSPASSAKPFELADLGEAQLAELRRVHDLEDVYPAAPIQQGMLFESLYDEAHKAYFNQVACRFPRGLDDAALREALAAAVARHAILRTSFAWEDLTVPHQVVHRTVATPFESHDLRELPAEEATTRLESLMAADRERGFALDAAPLLRLTAVHLPDGSSQLVWSHHHAILDGWSLPKLLEELLATYQARLAGEKADLPPSPPYRDYIAWLNQRDRDAAKAYWQAELNGFQQPTPLPGSTAPSGEAGVDVATYRFTRDQTEALRELARTAKVTLNTVVQAGWALLLTRINGGDEAVFGVTMAGRSADVAGIDDMQGVFINTLPIRLVTPAASQLDEWLRAIQAHNLDLDRFAYSRLADVLDWSGVRREQALFESIISFKNLPTNDRVQGMSRDLALDIRETHQGHNQFPLSLIVEPGASMTIEAFYQRQRFAEDQPAALLHQLAAVLANMGAQPQQHVNRIGLVAGADRAALTAASTGEPRRCFPEQTVNTLFATQVARRGEQPALIHGDRRWTYAETDRLTAALAHRLRGAGIRRGVAVGLCLPRTAEMAVALLAVLRTGAVVVPLDPRLPHQRLAFTAENAAVRWVIGAGAKPDWLDTETSWFTVALDARPAEPLDEAWADVDPEDPAYIIYTSGSTGRPKGVAVSHRAIANYAQALEARLNLPEQAELTTLATVAADLGHTALFGALCTGRPLRLLAPELAFDAEALADALERQPTDVLKIVPSHLEGLLAAREPARLLPRHILVLGGEALSAALAARLRDLAPQCRIVNHYGPSEATVGMLTFDATATSAVSGDAVPIGRPLANCAAWVLDRHLNPVPSNVPGELFIGGACLAHGYRGAPALTAERFVPDPFSGSPGARMYRTGDRVQRNAEGALVFLGRVDHQVKIRGYRVEPGELEAWLRSQPEIRDAAVRAWALPQGVRLAAYLVPAETPFDQNALQARMAAELPDYLVPSYLIELEALPLTLNGKVDRAQLPEPEQATPASRDRDPDGPVEQALAEIWCALLGRERIGAHEGFFEMGGDSILNLQATAKARQQGILFTPKQLFENQTVADLARIAKVKQAPADTDKKPTPDAAAASGDVPLTPIQHWFFETDPANPHHWNQSLLLETRQSLDPAILAKIPAELAARHEALRARFDRDSQSRPRQKILARDQAEIFAHIDLTAAHDADVLRHELVDLDRRMQASLNLEQGPLWRMVSIETAADRPDYLLLIFHHLIVDGVSWRILLQDLSALYRHHADGAALPAADPGTSQRAWVDRLQALVTADRARAWAETWQRQTGREPQALPLDFEGGPVLHGQSETLRITLDRKPTETLLRTSNAAYRTHIDELLLAPLARVLSRWIQSPTIHLELEGHGRDGLFDDLDPSRTVGWFTSRYPVALTPGEAGIDALIKAVKQQMRELPPSAGFGAIKYLDGTPDRFLAPRISFNYLGQTEAGAASFALATPVRDFDGAHQDPNNRRRHLLTLTAEIADGQWRCDWTYSTAHHRAETVQALADAYRAELAALIEHTADPAQGGATPADFELLDLDQAALDRLLAPSRWRAVEDAYPVAPMQRGMLYHALADADNDAYHNQFRCELEGPFDGKAFAAAWQAAVARHAILRTGFAWDTAGEPLQLVYRDAEMPIHREDWSHLTRDQQEAACRRYLARDREQGFVLAQAPLMRLALFRTGPQSHVLVWSRHHLLLDGWCSGLLIEEVLQRYRAALSGTPWHAPKPHPYRDFIAWLAGRDREEAMRHWRARLAGFEAPTLLPKRTDVAAGTGFGDLHLHLSEAQTQALNERARRHGVTLNTLFQAAWALLLGRYTGEAEVLFGVTVAGRPADLDGMETMLGVFINTLPLRLPIPAAAAPGTWLKEVQRRNVEDRQFEATPLSDIQSCAEVPAGTPLFETLLVFENYPDRATELPGGLRLRESDSHDRTHYPLTLVVQPGERLDLRFDYRLTDFDPAFIARMGTRLIHLLDHFESEPRLDLLPLLDEAERRQVLEAGVGATVAPQGPSLVHHWFETQARKSPDAAALVQGDETMTYGDLAERAAALADHVTALGAGPGERVAILLDRGPAMAVAVLAVLRSGAAYVPLDPMFPSDRIGVVLADAEPAVVLTQPAHAASCATSPAQVLELDGSGTPQSKMPTDRAATRRDPDPADAAYIIYTSGSTGTPKGVTMGHEALSNLIAWQYRRDPAPRTTTQFASLSFDVSFQEMFTTWATGGSLVLVDEGARRDSRRLAVLLARHAVARCYLPVVALHYLATALRETETTLPALRQVITAGEQLRLPVEVRETLATHMPHVALANHYGPSETHVVTHHELVADPAVWPTEPPIGRPIDNARVYVLDAASSPMPAGVPGELFLGGVPLARGYWNDPARTAARFVPDPFAIEPGGRLYRTGDRVRFDESGELHFLDRVDRQVKIRGYRVEPGDVESALCRHASVTAAAVTPFRDAAGRAFLVAYVQPDPSAAFDEETLRSHLGESLPGYMVPAQIVEIARIPLTASGKLDRRALPKPAATATRDATPQNDDEQLLCALWAEVLGTENAGLDDHFFELGGHSLAAAQLVARVRNRFHIALPIRALFDHPTPRELIRRIRENDPAGEGPALVPVDRTQPLPLSFGQRRLWFVDRLDGADAAYNIGFTLRLDGVCDAAALERALSAMVARHEILRTHVAEVAGEPVQVIAAAQPLTLPVTSLEATDEAQRETAIREAAEREKNEPFDLARGPLFRVRLLRIGAEAHVFLITFHHIAFDGWSVGVFSSELARLYRAFVRGETEVPAPSPIQYADYAAWQRRLLTGGELNQRRAYWLDKLTGLPEKPALPTDRPRGERPDAAGAERSLTIGAEPAQALLEFGRNHGTTQFMTLLALFRVLLAHRSDTTDFAIGAPDAGRVTQELEGLIGFFVNQQVLRTELRGDERFGDLLQRERTTVLEAQNHGLPFEMLVELLGVRRQWGVTPLTQVQFNTHDMAEPETDLDGLAMTPIKQETTRSRFDLAMHTSSGETGLDVALVYRTALFDAATIQSMLEGFETLVVHLAAHPEASIDDLFAVLAARSRRRLAREENRKADSLRSLRRTRRPGTRREPAARTAIPATSPPQANPAKQATNEPKPRTASPLSGPRGRRRQAIQVQRGSLVEMRPLATEGWSPLLVTPSMPDFHLTSWLEDRRTELEEHLARHGAILFRGFDLDGEVGLERFIRAASGSDPMDYPFGTTPRSRLHGRIYTSTDYPPDQEIPLHNENAYTNLWPMKIFFHCMIAPAEGGATPLVDSRAVYRRIPAEVRERVASKKLMYVRNFSELAVPWRDAFQTDDRAEVDAWCARNGIEHRWLDDHRLHTRQICEAVAQHPRTGEAVWFNQAHLFHVSALPAAVRTALLAEMREDELPRHVFYGDGSPLEDEVLAAVRSAYLSEKKSFPWRKGEVLMLDNMLTAHGRDPFAGPRKIVVGMAQPSRPVEVPQPVST
ncbi:Amino acid adenylation domain-containing protein [Sulfidibacter corallicola]|uniref:Amino acid adenylation domain-containing protein n=1 Tax=Sulfidibacter corallicola TaxID=2818388 RepID=A0A8A4THY0_SULCO|nr:non-ribosomal peptide synthetase [Sulfidibacter corallicola]QTD48804.1 amino acid adenylation domain-containing protein [Sulfidibacter corallicola]